MKYQVENKREKSNKDIGRRNERNKTEKKREKKTGFLNTRNTQEEKKKQKKKKSSKKNNEGRRENRSKINKQPSIHQSSFLNTSMHFDLFDTYELDRLLRNVQ